MLKMKGDSTHAVKLDNHPESTGKTAEEFQRAMGFQRLRLGFKLSVVTVALLAIGALFYYALFVLLFPIALIYVLSVHERANGWKLLGFQDTFPVMWLCAIFVMATSLFFPEILGAQKYALLLPFLIWAIYTYVENRSLTELDKKFGLDLRPARLAALLGIIALAVAYGYEMYFGLNLIRISWFLYAVSPFQAFIFAFPFLIVSSAFLIIRLEPASKGRN